MYCRSENWHWFELFLQNDDEPLISDDDVEGESDEEGGGDLRQRIPSSANGRRYSYTRGMNTLRSGLILPRVCRI